jgi:hypothetical protein
MLTHEQSIEFSIDTGVCFHADKRKNANDIFLCINHEKCDGAKHKQVLGRAMNLRHGWIPISVIQYQQCCGMTYTCECKCELSRDLALR